MSKEKLFASIEWNDKTLFECKLLARKITCMSKEKSLFAAIEWNGRTLNVLGYIPAEELKKIADDFENGIEVKHEQVEVVDGKFVSPRLLAIARETQVAGRKLQHAGCK